LPREPFHGDPRHYEQDITELKAKIVELEAEKKVLRHFIHALERQLDQYDADAAGISVEQLHAEQAGED
jgi:hypothetical protein